MLALAVALVAIGCGDSGDTTETSESTESTAATKAVFIKQADAICAGTDKKQEAILNAFVKEHPKADGSDYWNEKVIVAALPAVQVEAEEIAALTPPSGDEKEIEAIVVGLEKGVESGRADPSTMLGKSAKGPLVEVGELAREYGFKACATPL